MKRVITEDFYYGNFGDVEVTKTLHENSEKESLLSEEESGKVSDVLTVDSSRKCLVSWIDPHKPPFKVSFPLYKILDHVNNSIWKYELKNEWNTSIQYTKYTKKGHHYAWHQDDYKTGENVDRKLSIIYSLSHEEDYKGGNFDIKQSNGEVWSVKFDYGDFIVFPSNIVHRVRPLRSGERITLVGWYR